MAKDPIIRIRSISEFFEALNGARPKHPLIGMMDMADFDTTDSDKYVGLQVHYDLYVIFLKDGQCGLQYGRNKYDFQEGVLHFIGPGKFTVAAPHTPSTYGFMLLFHPDLLRNFELGKTISRYGFFQYDNSEALHLSKREEETLLGIASHIRAELDGNIDKHSTEVLVNNLQLMLNYSQRYYERQFITRTNASSDVVRKVEEIIRGYYQKGLQLEHGTPSPSYFAEQVHFSTNYLSDLLRKETGKTTKELVDDYVIELAKTELLDSPSTVSEIAYNLGFNYPHYFSRMFKKRTGETPQQYRSRQLS